MFLAVNKAELKDKLKLVHSTWCQKGLGKLHHPEAVNWQSSDTTTAKFNSPKKFSFEKPIEWPDRRYRIATKLEKMMDQCRWAVWFILWATKQKRFISHSCSLKKRIVMIFLSLWQSSMNISSPEEILSMREPVSTSVFSGREKRLRVLSKRCMTIMFLWSETCEFGASMEKNIRDHIVVGIQDKELSRRLQLMVGLTLAETIQTVRQSEEVTAQVSLQGDSVRSVEEVHHKKRNVHWQPKHSK